MSRPGNCYDNAAMESFWSNLKRALVHRGQFVTRADGAERNLESKLFRVVQCVSRFKNLNQRFLFLDGRPFQFIQCAETAGGKSGFHAELIRRIVEAHEEE